MCAKTKTNKKHGRTTFYLCIKHVFKPKFKENLKLFGLTLSKSFCLYTVVYTVCSEIFIALIFFF